MVLWTLQEIADITGGKAYQSADIQGVSINTRTLEKGDMYIALQGVSQDGHAFLNDAFDKGAVAALIDHKHSCNHPHVAVDDPFKAMYTLASAARARSKARIVGITGSVGKTSTRQMMSLVLSAFGKTSFSQGGHNNHWGLPLSLCKLETDAAFGVFEMGMNHENEIRPLTKLAKPHVVIITNVEKVHLENFDNYEGLAKAKAEILEGLEKGGTAILNRDNVFYDFLQEKAHARGAQVLSFGLHEKADIRLCDDGVHAFGQTIKLALKAPGNHMMINALAVLGAAHALGLNVLKAAEVLSSFEPLEGRGHQKDIPFKGGMLRIIDESYNASFPSIQAALALLKDTKGRRVVVLGDMLELGAESEAIHMALKDGLLSAGVDVFFACGPCMKKLYDALPQSMQGGFADHNQALAPLVYEALKPGDVCLVKGSRRWKLDELIKKFYERKAV